MSLTYRCNAKCQKSRGDHDARIAPYCMQRVRGVKCLRAQRLCTDELAKQTTIARRDASILKALAEERRLCPAVHFLLSSSTGRLCARA